MSEAIKLGKYQILSELGRGGFGIVYEAVDTILSRSVAVKVLHPALTVDPQFLHRFRQEATLAARMEHPNIVTIHDFAEVEGRYCIVMSLMRNGSLKDRLTKRGALSTFQAQTMLKQVGSGLAYAHEQGIIHRDLKPGNILIDEHGIARVADFGFAKALDGTDSMTFSSHGNPLGTAAYMAPEIWEGKDASLQSDIYSLGCIGHEMLTGKALFEGESTAQIVTQHVVYGPQLAPDLSAGWRHLLTRCLAKHPNERYASANAFLEDLQQGDLSAPREHPGKPVLPAVEARKMEQSVNEDLALRGQAVSPAFDKPETAEKVVEKNRSIPIVKEKRAEVGHNAMPVSQGNVRLQPSSVGQNKKKWLLPGLLGMVALVLMVILVLLVQKNNTAKWAFYTQQTQSVTPTYTRTITPTQTNTPTPTKVLTPTRTSTITPTLTPTLGIGSTMIREKDGMEMVYVPEGTFIMGSEDSDARDDEKPVRNVRLDAYWIDKYEVSNGQYAQCVADGGCTAPRSVRSYNRTSYYGNADYADYPVIHVNWSQAQSYCQWAGGDLPTEAQWEKAARGKAGNKYPWGNEAPSCNLVNYSPDWSNNVKCVSDTTAVGSYPRGTSPYGAMDMAGNVWEWVRDWYNTYDPAQTDEPEGPGSGQYRVLRGGSWNDGYWYLRTSSRSSYYPTDSYNYVGFRCVLPQP